MAQDSDAVVREQTPLDAEPSVRAKPKNGAAKKRKVKEYVEEVAPEGAEQDAQPSAAEPAAAPFADDSPLDGDAEAALSMCEVERVGPGKGPGWVGNLFDYSDGRGPQSVTYARVGSYPRTADIYDEITRVAGGGRYRFVTKGHPVVFKYLPTAPLPLPSEQEQQAQQPGMGAYGSYNGGPAPYEAQADLSDPFGASYDPEAGIDPDQVQSTGLNGWFRGGPYNRLLYYVNGVPSHPPRGLRPPAALMQGGGGGGMGGFDPAAYDHSGDDRVSKLEKLVEKLVERLDNNPRADQEALRWEKEMESRREERERDRERREEERERLREDRERDREARVDATRLAADAAKAQSDAARSVAVAQAEATKEVAKLQADAMKTNATASVDAAREMAKAQADNSKQLVSILLQKTDSGSEFDRSLDRALKISGMLGGEKSEIERALSIGREMIPTLTQGVADIVNTYRGNAPGQGNGGAPALGAEETQKAIPVFGALLKMCAAGAPPDRVPFALAVACETSGADLPKIRDLIVAAGADGISAWIDSMGPKVTSEEMKARLADAKALVTSAEGRAWIQAAQQALRDSMVKQVAGPAAPGK